MSDAERVSSCSQPGPHSPSLAINIPPEADEFVTLMSPSTRCSPGVRDNDAVTRAGADTRSFYR